ncbi:hypothetical protein DPX16_22236 [Anabarilius grahami]|uniref:Uncharacterized protein n=1 Tax=Anabarilius grahami TaxID=495550 RepID=A0A3N0XQE5_ANAGA|nr:hypothetical protein DPX16_22236 [Anabarilius grahami]
MRRRLQPCQTPLTLSRYPTLPRRSPGPLRPAVEGTESEVDRGEALWRIQSSVAMKTLAVRCHSLYDILQCV